MKSKYNKSLKETIRSILYANLYGVKHSDEEDFYYKSENAIKEILEVIQNEQNVN